LNYFPRAFKILAFQQVSFLNLRELTISYRLVALFYCSLFALQSFSGYKSTRGGQEGQQQEDGDKPPPGSPEAHLGARRGADVI